MKYKSIPIKAAKQISKNYEKNVVVIIAFDKKHNNQHVTTYGKSYDDCVNAAKLGNYIKLNVLGWPKEKCNAKPSRQIKKEAKENI
jgi:hypothetical protein